MASTTALPVLSHNLEICSPSSLYSSPLVVCHLQPMNSGIVPPNHQHVGRTLWETVIMVYGRMGAGWSACGSEKQLQNLIFQQFHNCLFDLTTYIVCDNALCTFVPLALATCCNYPLSVLSLLLLL